MRPHLHVSAFTLSSNLRLYFRTSIPLLLPRQFRSIGQAPSHGYYAPHVYTRACSSSSSPQSNKAKLAVSTALFRTVPSETSQFGQDSTAVLLIKRGKPPENVWALPGGSVCPNESLLAAAARELHEETSIPPHAVRWLSQPVDCYRVAIPNSSTVFEIHVFAAVVKDFSNVTVVAGDDAKDAAFYPPGAIETLDTLPTIAPAVHRAREALMTEFGEDV